MTRYNEKDVDHDDDESGDDVEALLVDGGEDGDLLLAKSPLQITPVATVPPPGRVSGVWVSLIHDPIPRGGNS